MLFQTPMYHQNKGEGVCFYHIISMYICIICTHYVCLYFIYLYLFTNKWPILESEGIGALFWAHFLEKGHFSCSHS